MSRTTMHPTKAILVETVVEMLESIKPADIQADKVLEISGISKGSLYHHFEDLGELVEAAQIARYAKWIDISIDVMANILPKAKNIEELRQSLSMITKATQRHDLSKFRLERARALANAEGNLRFQKALATETDRLTSLIEDLCREVIEKGWFRKDLNPRAVAVFIQAYTLGKLVDDFSPNRVSEEEWNALIDGIVFHFFTTHSS